MEHVYKPRMKVDEIFNLTKFKEFQRELQPFTSITANLSIEEICRLNSDKIGPISKQTLEKVKNANVKEITEPYFLHKIKEIPIPDEAKSLKCVRRAVNHVKKHRNTADRIQRSVMVQVPPNEVKDLRTAADANEIVFVVKIFEPFKYITGVRRCPKIGQEVKLLGSHYLTTLRDIIRCNDAPLTDISENLTQEVPKEESTSGFIFVNDTFYNDTRDPENLDYSEVIKEWTEKRGDFRELNKAQMEETQIKDLKFKVGFPYVFQHYGNCEHLIMFSDVRLVTRKEVTNHIGFPMVLNSNNRQVYCFVCGLIEACYIIQGSKDHIQDPSLLCSVCLHEFHYKDGKKIGDFQVFLMNKNS